MRTRLLSIIALLALAWPATARASTVSLDTYFQGYGAEFVVAGHADSFVIGSVGMSAADGLGHLDAIGSFEAFCVDFSTDIFNGPPSDPDDGLGVYSAELGSMTVWEDGGHPQLHAEGSGQRAAWLYTNILPTLAAMSGIPNDPNDPGLEQREALQMAIWNALYDSDFTVTPDAVPVLNSPNHTYFTNLNSHPLALAYAEDYLEQLRLATLSGEVANADAAWIKLTYPDSTPETPRDAQDFIGPAPSTTPVPEPSSMLLLGTGMAALAAFRSRKTARRS